MQLASVPVSAIARKAAAPHGPSQAFAFSTARGHHLLVADGSRVYDVDEGFAQRLADAATRGGAAAERGLLAAWGLLGEPAIRPGDDALPPVNALSLAISQRLLGTKEIILIHHTD